MKKGNLSLRTIFFGVMISVVACTSLDKNDSAAAARNPAQTEAALEVKYKKLDVDDSHVTFIKVKGKYLESPTVSADGKRIMVMSDLAKAPINMVLKDLENSADEGHVLFKNPLDLFIKGDFIGDDQIVACELKWQPEALPETVENYWKTKEWDPRGYHSKLSFFKNEKRNGFLDNKDFGLPDKTFLEHPKVAPLDQRWLTFYVQASSEMQEKNREGIYVYNRNTNQTFFLGTHSDKHPTWSADGKKIFFHEQGKMIGGQQDEIARIGYYNIVFHGDRVDPEKTERVIFDSKNPFGSTYIYQKHPAYHQGLNTVFFHARSGEGCAKTDEDSAQATPTGDAGSEDAKAAKCTKTLGAISLDHPERGAVLLKMKYQGQKVSHAEHADVSTLPNSPLYFVGRINGGKNDQLLSLDFETLKAAADLLNKPAKLQE